MELFIFARFHARERREQEVAAALTDLSPLKSVGLHKLKGERKNQWAMTVNERWRICFEFRNGDAYDVEVVDYRKG